MERVRPVDRCVKLWGCGGNHLHTSPALQNLFRRITVLKDSSLLKALGDILLGKLLVGYGNTKVVGEHFIKLDVAAING